MPISTSHGRVTLDGRANVPTLGRFVIGSVVTFSLPSGPPATAARAAAPRRPWSPAGHRQQCRPAVLLDLHRQDAGAAAEHEPSIEEAVGPERLPPPDLHRQTRAALCR